MASPIPQDSQNVVRPPGRARWFHLWCLPALWLTADGILWADVVIRNPLQSVGAGRVYSKTALAFRRC